jgi:hypothetical protein
MREIVKKAGMALFTSFQSIFVTLIIMRAPVRMSAGPVQYTGMLAAFIKQMHFSPEWILPNDGAQDFRTTLSRYWCLDAPLK